MASACCRRALAILDFYDGPLSGVFACGCCGTEYAFDTPDWIVHEERLRRIYNVTGPTLAQLEVDWDGLAYDEITRRLAERARYLRMRVCSSRLAAPTR